MNRETFAFSQKELQRVAVEMRCFGTEEVASDEWRVTSGENESRSRLNFKWTSRGLELRIMLSGRELKSFWLSMIGKCSF